MKSVPFIAESSAAAALLLMLPFAGKSLAMVPEYTVKEGAVQIAGVGPDSPVIYDNDWWFDVFDNNYLWAQASLGRVRLVANVVSRDMWEWQKGGLYTLQQSLDDAAKARALAESSGLKHIPDFTPGAGEALRRPASGRIEDTVPQPSEGSRLMVSEARKATPEKPLVIIAGGPLTTVANALLTDPDIARSLVVFNLTVSGGYNGKDGWSAWVVASRTRYVDWGGGEFWEKNSVFTEADFAALPRNPFCEDMRRLIRSDLGQANQLGDGAALVWLFAPHCWSAAEVRRAAFHGDSLEFSPVPAGESGDVLVIPRKATRLPDCRAEFFRVLKDPALFPGPD